MAFRYFPTKDATWLLAELDKALTDQSNGRVIVSASSGDVSFSHLTQMDIEERIRRIRYDLVVLDPSTYAPEDHIQPTRTRAAFR